MNISFKAFEVGKADHEGNVYDEDFLNKMVNEVSLSLYKNTIIPVVLCRLIIRHGITVSGNSEVTRIEKKIGKITDIMWSRDIVKVTVDIDTSNEESMYLVKAMGDEEKVFGFESHFEALIENDQIVGRDASKLQYVSICEHFPELRFTPGMVQKDKKHKERYMEFTLPTIPTIKEELTNIREHSEQLNIKQNHRLKLFSLSDDWLRVASNEHEFLRWRKRNVFTVDENEVLARIKQALAHGKILKMKAEELQTVLHKEYDELNKRKVVILNKRDVKELREDADKKEIEARILMEAVKKLREDADNKEPQEPQEPQES